MICMVANLIYFIVPRELDEIIYEKTNKQFKNYKHIHK